MTTEEAIERCESLVCDIKMAGVMFGRLSRDTGGFLDSGEAIRAILARLRELEHERARLIERWPDSAHSQVHGPLRYGPHAGKWMVLGISDYFPTREAAVLAIIGGDDAKGENQ